MKRGKAQNPAPAGLGKAERKIQAPLNRTSLPCTKCTRPLVPGVDTQKRNPNRFWSTCKRCRDKRQAVRHRSRLPRPPIARAQQDVLSKQQVSQPRALEREPENAVTTIQPPRRPDSDPVPSPRSEQTPSVSVNEWMRIFFGQRLPAPLPVSNPDTPTALERECSVCSERLPPEPMRLSACTHEPDICQDCFQQYLGGRMDNTIWHQIGCPSIDCSMQITHDDVKKFASEEMFIRYAPLPNT